MHGSVEKGQRPLDKDMLYTMFELVEIIYYYDLF